MRPVGLVFKQGLFRETRSIAETVGYLHPRIHVDPVAFHAAPMAVMEAVVQHELAHAKGRHALWCLLVLVVCFPLYPLARALCEVLADSRAVDKVGWAAYIKMVEFHGAPTRWWGRVVYGNRIRRVLWLRNNLPAVR